MAGADNQTSQFVVAGRLSDARLQKGEMGDRISPFQGLKLWFFTGAHRSGGAEAV